MLNSATLPTVNSFSFSPNRRSIRPIVCVASVQSPPELRRSTASFYDILRVKRNASAMEIKTAYRNLAKLYHPDSLRKPECDSDGIGRSFVEIHNAYETLLDPATRARYDLTLAALSLRSSYLYSVGSRTRSRPNRKWETDQCW